MRFYALRLQEAGMIKSSPQKIIAAGHRLALPERAEEGAEGMISRREFAARLAAAAAVAALSGLVQDGRRRAAAGDDEAADLPAASICVAPQYVAEDLLRAEGFTDVQYIKKDGPRAIADALASGEVDITMHFAGAADPAARRRRSDHDPGRRARRLLRAVRDRAGSHDPRSQGQDGRDAEARGRPQHVFLASMVAYVGLDPRKDINWVDASADESMQLLARGKDRRLPGLPAGPTGAAREEDRTRGRQQRGGPAVVAVLLLHGRGNREFVRKHPVATKRALRAILKGSRHLRPRARARGARSRRQRLHAALRLCAAGA